MIAMIDTVEPKKHTWREAWWKALTHPSVKTFEALSNDPTISGNRAYKWISVGVLIASLPALIYVSLIGFLVMGSFMGDSSISVIGVVFAVIAVVFIGVITVIFTAISVFIINLVARCLKGTGTYKQLIFVTAAYIVPLGLVSEYVAFGVDIIPFSEYFLLFLGLYGLMLSVIAMKAVHHFSWLKALVANFFLPVIFIGVIVIAVVVPNYPVVNVGKDFMSALENRNDAQAYNLCTPDLQAELGSPQNMKVILDEGGGQITDWGWWGIINNVDIQGNEAILSGSATFATGETNTLDLYLIYADGGWKVNGYRWQGDEGTLFPHY